MLPEISLNTKAINIKLKSLVHVDVNLFKSIYCKVVNTIENNRVERIIAKRHFRQAFEAITQTNIPKSLLNKHAK